MDQDFSSLPLEILLAHAPLAIAAADASGRLVLFSPALERLMKRPFQRVGEDELVSAYDLFAADGITRLHTEEVPLVRALRGEVVTDAVVTSRLADDHLVFLRCNASPLRDEHHDIIGAIVLVQDVTTELVAQQDQDRLRERLLATINHELRTPLAKIIGHAELLQDDLPELPPHVHRSVNVITRSADDLMRLADVISELAELEARTKVTPTSGNAAELVRECAAEVTGVSHGLALTVTVNAPERLWAMFDPAQTRRAVLALLDNALTYAPAGSRVEVTLAADREEMTILVADRGTGICDEDMERLREPFERGDHPLQTVDGKGLGLAVAHIVATAHGGHLHLSHRKPHGLCATLRLPRFGVVPRTVSKRAGVGP